ncbi:MAG TPA: DUF4129 domain-containing protein [Gemmatimonadaceae bacterium]|nr:DUF4129 domain-containing protein [Gemmatimonadaceae bacterium]
MLQAAVRVWTADAVHDTVDAVVHGAAFRRSIESSLGERLLAWLGAGLRRIGGLLDGRISATAIVLGAAGLLTLLVVARLVLAARARDADGSSRSRGGRAPRGEDPWRAAERLTGEGRFEDAAHALYRGVLASLAQGERLRLDPSRTSGDYARELRARGAASYLPFRAFGRQFDVTVYGRGPCDAAAVRELWRLAVSVSPRARAA